MDPESILTSINQVRNPVVIRRSEDDGAPQLIGNSTGDQQEAPPPDDTSLPPIYPEWLGNQSFTAMHGMRFPYVAGEMARGVSTTTMVIAMAKSGMLGFFGAAGLPASKVLEAIQSIKSNLYQSSSPWGINLIHSPLDLSLESTLVNLFLEHDVSRVSASAFMGLSPSVVHYACKGLYTNQQGEIQRRNHIFAKISRLEVAKHFMSPPPKAILDQLISEKLITREEAVLAENIPVSENITVEADSGGHTDNRPLTSLFPAIQLLRDELVLNFKYSRTIHLGAAGGIGTPNAVASAFALGASYVLTGSINQASLESGLSSSGKTMLHQAGIADTAMAPSADMFEIGAKVQVLQRGTLYARRACQLDRIYRQFDGLDDIPRQLKAKIEKEIFNNHLDEVWNTTSQFFSETNPSEVAKAKQDAKHKMALIFRWYLGKSSRWPVEGYQQRSLDYQIWCGPAMGAFNDWVANSFLSPLENRSVVQIALNLLEGAAVNTRAQQMRSCGLSIPASAFNFTPRPLQV